MKKLLFVASCILLLAGCQAAESVDSAALAEKPFHRMSEQELALYNASAEGPDQVYCIDEVRAGSHIKKRFCATVAEIAYALENDTNSLGVIHYGPVTDGIFTPGYSR